MTYGPPRTLVEALETIPRREGRGFRFFASDRSEHFYTYEQLWQESRRRAAHLQAAGMKKGDRLAMVIPEGHEFVLSFLGAVVAGVVPVPIFPRATFKAIDSYVDILAHIAEASGAEVMLTMEPTRPFVEKVFERDTGLEQLLLCEEAFAAEGTTPVFEQPEVSEDDLCFLQFTSGSTSHPKGVMVTHRNLVANATAFLGPHGLDRNDDDVGVSWLPLYHDMGLIGFILGTIVCDIPVVILPTATFARMPRIWLEVIDKYRGTITYAPNFAYQLVAKRVKDRDLAELDLSCVRVAGCGAEPIRAQTLVDFAERLRPAGFDGDRVYLPSYGMAEATLAITFHQLGDPLIIDRVDPEAMKRGEAEPVAADTADALELVSCGVPFPGHELSIVDDDDFVAVVGIVAGPEAVEAGPNRVGLVAGGHDDGRERPSRWGGGRRLPTHPHKPDGRGPHQESPPEVGVGRVLEEHRLEDEGEEQGRDQEGVGLVGEVVEGPAAQGPGPGVAGGSSGLGLGHGAASLPEESRVRASPPRPSPRGAAASGERRGARRLLEGATRGATNTGSSPPAPTRATRSSARPAWRPSAPPR